MKKIIRGSVVSVLVMMLLFTTVYGANSQKIDAILNALNISVNGEQIAKSGESYTLSNGTKVPYSISYAGTTYLPMKKVAELLNKNVEYVKETKTAKIMDKVGSEFLPPMAVSSDLSIGADGKPVLDFVLYNLSDKEIKSCVFNVYCYDKDFTPVIGEYNNNVVTVSLEDIKINRNESLDGSADFEDMKATEIYQIAVMQVTFTDGSQWGEIEYN